MLFNSFDFGIFLLIVCSVYWCIPGNKQQWRNAFIVVSSYVFYGWWDWRFLSLIAFSTLVDFFAALYIAKAGSKAWRKALLFLSLTVNIGLLGFFKYYNFFLENFVELFSFFGYSLQSDLLYIILPVGISFYTFQTMSYSIDVYRNKMEPTRDMIAFAAYVSFFPQLVAGPIERATHLLPQFTSPREFSYPKAVDGLRQILWGLFKKVVIADNCAVYANTIFNDYGEMGGSTLLLGAVFFAFQIYGDFSGYSDIAIGTARLFGIELMKNFSYPYFSRDIAEFWRRWHISLSTWFRDYLYIPLGGSKGGVWMSIRNTLLIFLISGLWHGANWTFIVWGLLNALYFLPLLLRRKNRVHLDVVAQGRALPNFRELLQMGFTFLLTLVAWIFFRSNTVADALQYLGGIATPSLFQLPQVRPIYLFVLLAGFIGVEWQGRAGAFALSTLGLSWPRWVRWAMYYLLIILLFTYAGKQQAFIYFQF